MKSASLFFSVVAGAVLPFAPAVSAAAQTFSVVHSFGTARPEPAGPIYSGVMAQGRDGNVYAASSGGGATNQGAIYRITPSGTFSVVYSFDGVHGSDPRGGLTLGADGNFYGTAYGGGANGYGTIFKITSGGTLTTLHNLTRAEGGDPYAPPVLAGDGNYYGTTSYYGTYYYGSIYRITPSGTFTVLHQFGSDTGATGGGASYAPLTLGPDGLLYGTASAGGNGVLFKTTLGGTYTVIYKFGSAGYSPYSALTVGLDKYLYGTTLYGGTYSRGVAFRVATNGTAYSVLHNFGSGAADGQDSYSGLLPASDGLLYGAASGGGTNSDGTLFKVTSAGSYTTLHTFNGTDGKLAESALLQTTDGKLYGQSFSGGAAGQGEIFKLSGTLKAFVKPLVPFAQVGSTVQLLGQGFVAGSTTVSFNGKLAASVSVQSPTFLTAVIPAGATTGTITVKTGTVSLSSLTSFKVMPTLLSFSPTSGKVGTKITLSGTGLSQASSVKINSVAATSVTIVSDSQVTAIVPTGATTGKISIGTPGGTATSAANFTISPTAAHVTSMGQDEN